ncbi:MAG: hypothetical protein WC586_12805 [Methanoregula sp.]
MKMNTSSIPYHPTIAPPPKISGTCPSRCPFLFRTIVKRHAITGSRQHPREYDASPDRS